ncbi:hypothetical protein ABIE26_002836 [Pedobacter africanus]|uniref:Uncharacterized protein n=1 Tax=Pedobacter africanus TaxID=151894 RepID=A0ACC6KWM5_9SPHI|nr:hypothetical protein [Pedobacter africanus]MDR6783775.1 hypothetical protein [Pedobacter africanus]
MNEKQEKITQAIDALISNIGHEGIYAESFMILLNISRPKAERLMMELHERKKLELKWVPGDYYNNK